MSKFILLLDALRVRCKQYVIFKYYVLVRYQIEVSKKMVKRIMVTLDDDQYEILKNLKGFGMKDAEKLRNIMFAYLSEKSYIKGAQNKKE